MIANIFGLFVEFFKLLLVMCGCLNYKLRRKAKAAWIVFGISLVCLVVIGIYDNSYEASTFNLVVALTCALLIEGKNKGILSFVMYLIISYVDDLLFIVLKTIFPVLVEIIEKKPWVIEIMNLPSVVVFGGIALVMQCFCYGKGKQGTLGVMNSKKSYLLLIAIGLSALILTMSPLTIIGFEWNRGSKILVFYGVMVSAVLFLLIVLLLIYNNNAKHHYEELAELRQSVLEITEKKYQEIIKREEDTRRFRHDITSHHRWLMQLLQENKTEEAMDYLEELSGRLSDISPKYQTGNALVNAIVNDVSGRYTDVILDWKGILPMKFQIPDMDVCVIFSNLFENAFHAASACEQGMVSVTVESVASALKVSMKNDMMGTVEKKNGMLVTKKKNKNNHGFGTRNVQDYVIRNDGTVSFECEGKYFVTKLTLLNAA